MTQLDPDRAVHAYVSSLYADRDDPKCRSRYIRLGIYPTAEALRTAAGRREAKHAGIRDPFDRTMGVFQPAPFRQRYDRKRRQWTDTTSACAGVMHRLSRA